MVELKVEESFVRLNVSAGSQKRAIHEPEGRDESRLKLKLKRNLDVTIVKYILSLLGQIVSLLGQTNCPGLRTLCPKRLPGRSDRDKLFCGGDRSIANDDDDQQQSRIRPASTMDRRRVKYLQELFGAGRGRVWI